MKLTKEDVRTSKDICFNNVKYMDEDNVEWFTVSQIKQWVPLTRVKEAKEWLKIKVKEGKNRDKDLFGHYQLTTEGCLDWIDKAFSDVLAKPSKDKRVNGAMPLGEKGNEKS